MILAILAAIMLPSLTGFIDRAKETEALAEARQVQLAAATTIIEWNGHYAQATPGTVAYRDEQQEFMKAFMGSECGMGREDYDCYGDNTFTTNTTTNNVLWSRMLDKSRGVNRAIIFLDTARKEIVGIFYVSKDGNYAVRIIYKPWTSANKAPEVATAGTFVERTK